MTQKTLLQRAEDKLTVWKLIEEMNGEITPEFEAWLSQVETDLATKVDHYKFTQDELEREAERLRKEAQAMSAAARTLENMVDALKDRIKQTLLRLETDELRGDKYRYKIAKSNPKLVIDREELPSSLLMVKTVEEPDQERIRTYLELGEQVPGAKLEPVYQLKTYVNRKD